MTKKQESLPMITQCCECKLYKNPQSGKFEKDFQPRGQLNIDYRLTHGQCRPCYVQFHIINGLSLDDAVKSESQ